MLKSIFLTFVSDIFHICSYKLLTRQHSRLTYSAKVYCGVRHNKLNAQHFSIFVSFSLVFKKLNDLPSSSAASHFDRMFILLSLASWSYWAELPSI